MAQSKLAQHHDYIRTALEEGLNKRKIADLLVVAPSTVKDYINSCPDLRDIKPPVAEFYESMVDEVSDTDKLKRQLADLEARARKVKTLDVQHEIVLDEIRASIASADVRFEPPALEPAGQFHRHVQAALLSDLHGGEVVDINGMDGLNEYNWAIMEDRIARWREALLSYKEYRPYPIDELHLWLLGDMCSGSNHAEIVETNEYSAAEQGVRMGFLLGQLVESLVPHYPKIIVDAVPGNHPRLPMKPASKQVFNNFDWVAYKIAEQHTADYPSVEWQIPMGGMLVTQVAGLNYLLFHGDGIRSTMPGVPWGGVVRRTNELSKTYMNRGVRLDGYALGHFHQANAVMNILMNGCVKGPDEHSVKNYGSAEPPTQLIVTFDADKQRRTDVSYINL